MSDKSEPTPDTAPSEDELRFAPPVTDEAALSDSAAEDLPEFGGEAPEISGELTPAPDVDLDAALAAISALDDMLAEQEAAEQAELARQQADEQARIERQTRLKSPELFFPMPPLANLQRGRLDSVVPALALIGLGAWLTFTLTTGVGIPAPALVVLVVCGGLALALLIHWLTSGRWALGTLFFGLCSLLVGGLFVFLLGQGSLPTDWPLLLIGPGLAFFMTGVIAGEGKLLLPGILLAVSSLAALAVTDHLLSAEVIKLLAGLWPLAVLIVILMLILPRFARRPRE